MPVRLITSAATRYRTLPHNQSDLFSAERANPGGADDTPYFDSLRHLLQNSVGSATFQPRRATLMPMDLGSVGTGSSATTSASAHGAVDPRGRRFSGDAVAAPAALLYPRPNERGTREPPRIPATPPRRPMRSGQRATFNGPSKVASSEDPLSGSSAEGVGGESRHRHGPTPRT